MVNSSIRWQTAVFTYPPRHFVTYTQALELLMEHVKVDVPPELWNNIGALRHQLGDLGGAAEAYGKAKEGMDGANLDEDTKNVCHANT